MRFWIIWPLRIEGVWKNSAFDDVNFKLYEEVVNCLRVAWGISGGQNKDVSQKILILSCGVRTFEGGWNIFFSLQKP